MEFYQGVVSGVIRPEQFIRWTIECIISLSFSLGIYGETCGYFQGKKELRQADPISSLIFVMAMEYFSRLMKKMSKKVPFLFIIDAVSLG